MTADDTTWTPVEGDHADDQSYERKHRDPNEQPTDEKRTQEDIAEAEERNKEDKKERAAANKAAGENE